MSEGFGSDQAPPEEIHTLTCKRDLGLATQCLETLIHAVGPRMRLVIHEDGSLGPDDIDRLLEALPGSRIVRRIDTESQVLDRLGNRPACRRYRQQHPLSNKLLDVPLSLAPDACLRFCDCDILFFRRVTELFPAEGRPVFCAEDDDGYSAPPWKLRWKFGFRIMSGLNSGLFQFPLSLLDLDFLEWFLGNPELLANPGMGEQTAWALLLRDQWPTVFSQDQILCSTRRPIRVDDRLLAIHFLYHLKERVPQYYPQAVDRLRHAPEAVPEFVPPRPLSSWLIVQRRLLRRWRASLN